MKLAARDIDAFIKYPHKHAGALIYGLDEGQVRVRVRELTEHWMGKDAEAINRVEFSADHIADDPARLSDELSAFSLLGGKRVVAIRDGGDSLVPLLEDALSRRAHDNFLIVYTHDALSGASKLRAFFERCSELAAVACYKDEGANLSALIRDTLRGYGLKLNSDVLEYLATRLQGDRQVVLAELEKISLYLGDEAEEVSMETALLLTADSREMSLDELSFAVAGGQTATLCRMIDTLTLEGVAPVQIIRSVMRYMLKLDQLAQARANGASLDVAIEQMRPPVFFKHKPILRQHAARWSHARLEDALMQLHHLEYLTKQEHRLGRVLLADALMRLAAPAASKKAA